MKKIYLFFITFLLIINNVCAAEVTTYGSYEDAIKMVKEVMKAYYLKGDRIQYNYARTTYGKASPEDATSQNILYSVCAAYTHNVYSEAFGMQYDSVYKFPRYNYEIIDRAREYYYANKDNLTALDGNFLIYYQNTEPVDFEVDGNAITLDESKYIYTSSDGEMSVSDFAELIEPGDLFAYSGHALIAYDKYQKSDGTYNVFILNSTQSPYIPTRIYGTNKISYSFMESQIRGNNGIINVMGEGTTKFLLLGTDSINGYTFGNSDFVKDGKIDCGKKECAVLRPIYNNSGEAKFNYPINLDNYKKSQLRVEYPGLDIDKIVNKGTNNSVYPGDELVYTVKITNKSNITSDTYDPDVTNKNYGEFYVEEEIDDSKVSFIEASSGGTLSGNKITWHVSNLPVGESISLTYKVKVINNEENIDTEIVSRGKFYKDASASIRLAYVKNKIIKKVSNKSEKYKECFIANSTKKGLELIDAVYSCAWDISFDFKNFSFDRIFDKKENIARNKSDIISIKSDLSSEDKLFVDMILNNYWSGLFNNAGNFYGEAASKTFQDLPYWSGNSAKTRAKTIYPSDFKDGDVLIYFIDYTKTESDFKHTDESGMYAYIYLTDEHGENGKFVGKNGNGATERSEFTPAYYGSDYKTHLYKIAGGSWETIWDSLNQEEKNNRLEFVNYQTLFDKDYYVILRPEIVIEEDTLIESPDTGIKTYSVFVSIISLIGLTILYFMFRSKTKFLNK